MTKYEEQPEVSAAAKAAQDAAGDSGDTPQVEPEASTAGTHETTATNGPGPALAQPPVSPDTPTGEAVAPPAAGTAETHGAKRATRAFTSPPPVKLEAYEGPLDLLLDLIRKQEIDIYDIPIARITQQYLEYMQKAAEMDIELSAEFVYMAATLIHIKSRLLLPSDPELDKLLPEEDPRQELVDRLLEHERFKNAAEMLQQKKMIEEAVWSNPQID